MANSKEQKPLEGLRLLITGGTGSFGQRLVKRLLTGEMGNPAAVIVFSRDEAKQHTMRLDYQHKVAVTDEIVYRNFQQLLQFRIGDVRDFHSLASVLPDVDVVFSAAAMKQVPTCEYFPYEAVRTNIDGPENIVRVIQELRLPVRTVVGISTDKACKPVNVMGMTKSIQERIFIQANLRAPQTRFVCVRYGNVLASRGSVIPLFHEQIRSGGPVTVTTDAMTRFLISLDEAVDTVFDAVVAGRPGEIFVPRAPSALIMDVARALIGPRPIRLTITGIRPGEKIHEIMVGEEEAFRTYEVGRCYAIAPMLPELVGAARVGVLLEREYSSETSVMSPAETLAILADHGLLVEEGIANRFELLA
jgi:FlaA1/EpsC-like NDP-sugar epimerase